MGVNGPQDNGPDVKAKPFVWRANSDGFIAARNRGLQALASPR